MSAPNWQTGTQQVCYVLQRTALLVLKVLLKSHPGQTILSASFTGEIAIVHGCQAEHCMTDQPHACTLADHG